MAQQQVDGDSSMHDADEDAAAGLGAGQAGDMDGWAPCLGSQLVCNCAAFGNHVGIASFLRLHVAVDACPSTPAPLVCRAAEPAAPSSRFAFEGPLAPVVMVAPVGGNSAGGAGTIPWRCAIDSFTGEEEVPQVSACKVATRQADQICWFRAACGKCWWSALQDNAFVLG